MHDDLVLGAGPAGLALAFRLAEAGRDVLVLEAAPRPGGLVRTLTRQGVTLEQGPQTLQRAPALMRLVEDLDLRNALIPADPCTHRRLLLHGGRLVALPDSLGALLSTPLLSRWGRARLLGEPLAANDPRAGESLGALAARRIGREATDTLLGAFVAGVFGGDPDALDAEATFPDLVGWERDHGSWFLGALATGKARRGDMPAWATSPMYSLQGGLETLIHALAERLGERVRLATAAREVSRRDGAWVADTGGARHAGRRLWVATGPAGARTLFPDEVPDMPRAPVAAVSLVYRREDITADLRGFGWLAPKAARADVLGCLWVTSAFPGHAPGHALLRVMVGGARAPELALQAKDGLIAHARRVLREVQDIAAEPVFAQVSAYTAGIPQYPAGWAATVRRLDAAAPDRRFVGWAFAGIGLSHAAAVAEAAAR